MLDSVSAILVRVAISLSYLLSDLQFCPHERVTEGRLAGPLR